MFTTMFQIAASIVLAGGMTSWSTATAQQLSPTGNRRFSSVEYSYGSKPPQPEPFGTTILVHGLNFDPANLYPCNPMGNPAPPTNCTPDVGGWMKTMGAAIVARGGVGGTVMIYEPATGEWEYESGRSVPGGELVLIFNWVLESDGLNLGGQKGFAEAAADALYAALRDPDFDLASYDGTDVLADGIHFIAHSRGTVVTSECTERLIQAGYFVDQVTMLDPHPVDESPPFDWGDPEPEIWSGVGWSDNYYRTDSNPLDFNGKSLPGSRNYNLTSLLESDCYGGGDPDFEHIKIHTWYHGTIDLSACTDGSRTICRTGCFPSGPGWYSHPTAPGSNEGYYYSENGGGKGARLSDGTRSTPSYSNTEVYNGDFEIVDSILVSVGDAGWRYHGGSRSSVTGWQTASPPPGSTYYAKLDASDPELTHNRMFVEQAEIPYDLRVVNTTVNGTRFRVILEEESSGTEHVIEDLDLSFVVLSVWLNNSADVPANLRGRTYRLRFALVGSPVDVSVHLDNVGAQGAGLRAQRGLRNGRFEVSDGTRANPVVLSQVPSPSAAASGWQLSLDCTGAHPAGVALFVVSLRPEPVPIATPCGELLVSTGGARKFLVPHAGGVVTLGPLPRDDPRIAGTRYYVQGFCGDAPSGSLSNALIGTLGF